MARNTGGRRRGRARPRIPVVRGRRPPPRRRRRIVQTPRQRGVWVYNRNADIRRISRNRARRLRQFQAVRARQAWRRSYAPRQETLRRYRALPPEIQDIIKQFAGA